MKQKIVDTSVASLWTAPESPRTFDQRILSNPVDLKTWLSDMDYEQRLSLCTENLVQSQALYGTKVKVLEERGEWLKVVIPDQPSSKDSRGYPGWMPSVQLSDADEDKNEEKVAVVNRPTAILQDPASEWELEVSFQTRLPVEEENENLVMVRTPSGTGQLRREDILCEHSGQQRSMSGKEIVNAGEQFIGLPYLWGGMSGFGYDCSGFAHMMHRSVGLVIPRDAHDQAEEGQAVEREQLAPGDLLFFAYEEGKGRVHHVAIYYGDGKMIHAPNTGKSVEVISFPGSKYEIEFSGARRYW
ncbi:MAG TPA: C40 family peptidase [Bacillales bacterium]|nr:C40 family peptidase [Bacillales bacterium]